MVCNITIVLLYNWWQNNMSRHLWQQRILRDNALQVTAQIHLHPTKHICTSRSHRHCRTMETGRPNKPANKSQTTCKHNAWQHCVVDMDQQYGLAKQQVLGIMDKGTVGKQQSFAEWENKDCRRMLLMCSGSRFQLQHNVLL